MKAVIAGGRDYVFTPADLEWLEALHKVWCFSEIISGAAKGADEAGEVWAVSKKLKVTRFPAKWAIHGNVAGPIRNRDMANYIRPDGLVILFPGGVGTAHMKKTALKMGLKVLERNHGE